jgi:hypothetical protein
MADAWTAARLLQNAIWNIEDGEPAIDGEAPVIAEAIAPRRESALA